MSMIEMYVADSLYLNAEQTGENTWTIHLSNGEDIPIEKAPVHNGSVWAWRIGSQVFGKDEYAYRYLRTLVTEKLTGKRIIFHAKKEVPDICGIEGRACRHPGECNTALCDDCPVAEKFFADRDGVELIYAVEKKRESLSAPYDVLDLAKYIIMKCAKDGCPISNLHLQKILYYIQKLFLSRGEVAFLDAIEAWNIGPVVPVVYNRFCGFGAMPISLTFDMDKEIDGSENGIDHLIEEKRVLMPWEMVNEVHREAGAWARVYDDGRGLEKQIPLDMIRQYG